MGGKGKKGGELEISRNLANNRQCATVWFVVHKQLRVALFLSGLVSVSYKKHKHTGFWFGLIRVGRGGGLMEYRVWGQFRGKLLDCWEASGMARNSGW